MKVFRDARSRLVQLAGYKHLRPGVVAILVRCYKDLPTALPAGCIAAGMLEREHAPTTLSLSTIQDPRRAARRERRRDSRVRRVKDLSFSLSLARKPRHAWPDVPRPPIAIAKAVFAQDVLPESLQRI
ncbi:uncharacterized protein BXZ73DRAFT_105528 [Epithele typhae]|uniref:uncharacterized protein n=1 Tax=Epithele typhae TaxID=378194 RepID=UPI0020077012|nr:uncharacterized protein BXZ73DRAFT_105528 [Epithele typhae]KAH9917364.1 hypothetical protein BXZ73DRAFT_105528 [Epithele typhae]